jgi:hypothetical protein
MTGGPKTAERTTRPTRPPQEAGADRAAMNAPALRPAPAIASIGAPPDLHAERVCGAMIQWLRAGRAAAHARAEGTIDLRQMGAPAGQQRVAERFTKALGDVALEIQLHPAKRGKFKLVAVDWSIWDPASDCEVENNATTPSVAWLAAVLTVYTGANRRANINSRVMLLVTRHAVVRLAQRAGVRTVDDLVAAMRELWRITSTLLVLRPYNGWLETPAGGWLMPIEAADGETLAVAVLERDRKSGNMLVVKTILDREMVDQGAMALTRDLLEAGRAARETDRSDRARPARRSAARAPRRFRGN